MNIVKDLQEVDDFLYVNTIDKFLEELKSSFNVKKSSEFAKFLSTTIIIFEKGTKKWA